MAFSKQSSIPLFINNNNNGATPTVAHPLEELRRKARESMTLKKKDKPEREEGEISDEEKNAQDAALQR